MAAFFKTPAPPGAAARAPLTCVWRRDADGSLTARWHRVVDAPSTVEPLRLAAAE